MKFKRHMIMAPEDGGEGGSAGGLGDGTPPVDDGGGQGAPDDNGGTPPDDGLVVPEWAKGLDVDRDILADPSLKAITDVNALTKSYVHAQRKIGQKGAIIPNENSTKEEWDTFYQKTGVPLEEQEYAAKFKFPSKEDGGQFDENFNAEFVKKAHEYRVNPSQASQMYDFFNDQAKATAERFQTEMEEKTQQELDALMNHYGEDAYNVKLNKAVGMLKEHAGEEFMTYLKDSGLGKNAKVVDAFIKMADKFYGEEELPSGPSSGAISKQDAQREINTAMGDFNDPYHKPDHPDHKRRVDEVQKYFAILDK